MELQEASVVKEAMIAEVDLQEMLLRDGEVGFVYTPF
jgi:hypothetical protein